MQRVAIRQRRNLQTNRDVEEHWMSGRPVRRMDREGDLRALRANPFQDISRDERFIGQEHEQRELGAIEASAILREWLIPRSGCLFSTTVQSVRVCNALAIAGPATTIGFHAEAASIAYSISGLPRKDVSNFCTGAVRLDEPAAKITARTIVSVTRVNRAVRCHERIAAPSSAQCGYLGKNGERDFCFALGADVETDRSPYACQCPRVKALACERIAARGLCVAAPEQSDIPRRRSQSTPQGRRMEFGWCESTASAVRAVSKPGSTSSGQQWTISPASGKRACVAKAVRGSTTVVKNQFGRLCTLTLAQASSRRQSPTVPLAQ